MRRRRGEGRPAGGSPRGLPSWLLAAVLLLAGAPASEAQLRFDVEDLVFTGGGAVEGYQGNLPSAAVTAVDSTEYAAAAVGEFGVRGSVGFLSGEVQQLRLSFDSGLRQFAATGFEFQDYAPREWVGRAEATYQRRIPELGLFRVQGHVRGREVSDRPPMPLFLQPAYWGGRTAVAWELAPWNGLLLDTRVQGEWARYHAPAHAPSLRLLDREALELEMGSTWGLAGGSSVRGYAGFTGARFPRQATFAEEDPFRRDRTYRAGAVWSRPQLVYSQVGVEVAANRSNSRRPEYDALSVQTVLSTPVWGEVDLTLFALLTAKRYVHPTEFARLIPGEEADNASIAYVSLSRPLARNLDGSVRLGWTRAETDIGDHYYQRLGLTFLLNYRPGS